jgi:hypothetical protein
MTQDTNTPLQDSTPADAVEVIKPKKVKLTKPKTAKAKTDLTGNLEINTITGKVAIKHADGSETETSIPIKEVVISKPMVNVGMSAQHTKNLGNYESAKISISLFVPCDAVELEDTFNFVKDWVNGKMLDVIQEIGG